MAGEVYAAFIAAAAAVAVAAGDLVDRHTVERRRRESEMLVAALDHFKESQRRSVGIATLAVLQNGKTWKDNRGTIQQLFYLQLVYLYEHGQNRWQAHEIANIEMMTSWLLEPSYLGPPAENMKEPLCNSMSVYRSQQFAKLDDDVMKKASQAAVTRLQGRIDKWLPILHNSPTATRAQ